VFVIGAVFPPVGEVSNSCVEYSGRNVRGERGIVEDARFKSLVHVGMSQGAEGVILVPPSVPIEPLELCQVFGEVGHFLVGVAEALDFSS